MGTLHSGSLFTVCHLHVPSLHHSTQCKKEGMRTIPFVFIFALAVLLLFKFQTF
jgi:hypothetical protein